MVLDLKTIQILSRVTLPNGAAKGGWSINALALADAISDLGLEKPIRIRYQGKGIYRRGTHYATLDNDHRIVLSTNLSPEEANKVLWHELCHALQAELFSKQTNEPMFKFYDAAYRPARGKWGASYYENAMEIEARTFANANSDRKLIKEGG